MNDLTLKAMAKINLGLDVVRRLENGYHEVKMVMQTIDLYDELTFIPQEKGILLQIPGSDLPADDSNLIIKAAKRMQERHPFPGVQITLKKNIPMAAGMAGGSTDAAATLVGLNRMFALNVSDDELAEIAVGIGADVPFCLCGGTQLSEGIGEILRPLPAPPKAWLVIAKPEISVSTKYVYENLHVDTIGHHPDVDGVVCALEDGNLKEMCNKLENILETVTEKEYPVIAEIKTVLKNKGALTALMSGSGPTVFGIFESSEMAKAACEELNKKKLAKQLFVTTFIQGTCMEK